MSRYVTLYYNLRGESKQKRLDDRAIDDFRQANTTLKAGAAKNFPSALRQQFGLPGTSIKPDSAAQIKQALQQVTESQTRIEARLDAMAVYIKQVLGTKRKRGNAGKIEGSEQDTEVLEHVQ